MPRRCNPLSAIVLLLLAPAAVAVLDVRVEARALHWNGWTAERVSLRGGEALSASLEDLRDPSGRSFGDLGLRCAGAGLCTAGNVEWSAPGEDALTVEFTRDRSGGRVSGPAGHARIDVDTDAEAARELRVEGRLDALDALPVTLLQMLGLAVADGAMAFRGRHSTGGGELHLELRDAGFDTADGGIAGAGLGARLSASWRDPGDEISISARWSAGEALFGPLYLPPPEQPVRFELALSGGTACAWKHGRARVVQGSGIDVRARLEAPGCEALPATVALELRALSLERLWALGGDSLAASRGWAGLAPAGHVRGTLQLDRGVPVSARLALDEGALSDAQGRLAIQGGQGQVQLDAARGQSRLALDWQDAAIYRLALGGAALRLATDESGVLRLTEPLVLPVADGHVVVERFEWNDWQAFAPDIALDARIEPISLAAVSRAFGWTALGGSISGRFPGLQIRDGVIAVDGGFEVAMFDGIARVGALALERPFGALPALSGDVDFENLDLELLTGAFEFGYMTGRLSGHLRELRLLDWQPVRFDAWFETRTGVPKRRISQQAVDALSTIGGGGGAALSGTLLRIFDDFPYRRVGLGCRLANNVCQMRGLEPTEGGGYLIVEGRPFPLLNVVAHRRRVDWPRLLAQLAAVTRTSE